MSYNNSAQAPFHLRDSFAFDFDFEAPETSQAMNIDSPVDANNAEDFETFLTGSPRHATQIESGEFGMMDALPTTSEIYLSLEDLTVIEPMADVDADALHNPGSLPSSPPSWQPPTLDFLPEPSRWVPVSPELQQQLNTTYAPQLDLLACDPNPAPVLFLAAEDQMVSPERSAASHPSGDLSGYELPQTSEPRVGTASIDPSLLMRESIGLSPPRLPSYDTPSPSSSITEHCVPNDAALAPITTRKRAFEADESESEPEPAPKRIKTAEAEPMVDVAMDEDSEEGEESDEKPVSLSQPDLLPVVVKEDEPEPETEAQSHDESDNIQEDDSDKDSISSDLSSPPPIPTPSPAPVAQQSPSTRKSSHSSSKNATYWRYEQANEADLRNQRRKQWSDRLRKDSSAANGKTPSRKMQKLLEEIEDSQGFVEAQGCKAGECVGGNDGDRRPVRSGARKSYVGLE